MTERERYQYVTGQVASGRRAGFRLLELLEVGFTPKEAVHAVAPSGLSPVAFEAAVRLGQLASVDLMALSIVLAGLIDDSTLSTVNIPVVSAQAHRAWQGARL